MIILDAGHGGYHPSKGYMTAPNKMAKHEQFTIYEGVVNRHIVSALAAMLDQEGINYAKIADKYTDTSLGERCRRIITHGQDRNIDLVVSVHANAYSDKSANGWQIHTSTGETSSDQAALKFLEAARDQYGQATLRKEAEANPDWDSGFLILTGHQYPSVLTENFFFTNKDDAQYLNSDRGIKELATLHAKAIQAWLQVT
jgi:N-acetylmuramoyl-L-alanine amidase